MSELITVIRYIEQDPQVVLRSQAGDPAGVQAWANGDECRFTLGKFEVALPWDLADALTEALADRLDERDDAAGIAPAAAPSIIGRAPVDPALGLARHLFETAAGQLSAPAAPVPGPRGRVVARRWDQLTAAEQEKYLISARAQYAAAAADAR